MQARGIEFIGINAGKLRRYFSLRTIVDFFRFLTGIGQALFVLARLRPRLMFSKGGFVSVAPVIAAGILKIPVIAHDSDYDPGLATRINLRFTSIQCIPFEESRSFYSSQQKIVVTGNPVRQLNGNRDRGLKLAGLGSDLPVLLVLGGSLGARQLNSFIKGSIARLLEYVQIIHQTGQTEWNIDEFIPGPLQKRYFTRPFFSEDYAHILATADIVLSRAGGGALWELGMATIPAVFVPLMTGTRGDQLPNARYAESRGAAITCVSPEELASMAEIIIDLSQDSARQQRMAAAWSTVIHSEGAQRIARLIDGYPERKIEKKTREKTAVKERSSESEST